jgi:hypothetical protein
MNNNLTEDQRRDLAALFLSKGWQLLKTELDGRAKVAARSVIFGLNRETDDINRGFIKAIEQIVSLEKAVFAQPDVPQPPPQPASTDRYDVV